MARFWTRLGVKEAFTWLSALSKAMALLAWQPCQAPVHLDGVDLRCQVGHEDGII